jgi:pilus assembly protein Flp/PilA
LRLYLAQKVDRTTACASADEEIAMLIRLHRFLNDESGATAIEYGLIAAGISVAIIAVVNGLGTSLNAKFKSISTQLK